MYRLDIASGLVEISWNDEVLTYTEPPLWTDELPDGSERIWRMPVDIEVEDPATSRTHPVTGWIGILQTMNNSDSGIALFRRRRMIIGGPGDNWRPHEVCGAAGSHQWKRLVGELHMNSFPVNFSKDGFAWDAGLEENLIKALVRITGDYRKKASSIRVRQAKVAVQEVAEAVRAAQDRIDQVELNRSLAKIEMDPRRAVDISTDPREHERLQAGARGPTELKIDTPGGPLVARLYVRDDSPQAEWLSLQFAQPNEVDVFLNESHPFVAGFAENDLSFGMIANFALALALAEKRARTLSEDGRRILPDDLRTHLDVLLKHLAP